MSVVINTNFAATVAANNLSNANAMLQKSLNRLSSGSRITTPADDAGGLAVSMKLTSLSGTLTAANNILGNQVSMLQTQDGALNIAAKALTRMSQLAALAGDATMTSTDTANYKTEMTSLVTELGTIAGTQFNGQAVFGTGTIGGVGSCDLTTAVAGLSSSSSVSTITTALTNVATLRAANGAAQSVNGFAQELNTIQNQNVQAANSRISDVDVAQESTQLARWNVLTSAGTSMLAQANQSAQSVLKLLQ